MDGPRVPLLVVALLAGLGVGGTATAGVGDLPGVTTLTTVISGVVTTVTGVTDVTTATTVTDVTTATTVTEVITTTTTDTTVVSVPTVPTLPTTTTDPIDSSQPLPDLPAGGDLPEAIAGTTDATSEIVTTSTGGDATNESPLAGYTPALEGVSAFGSVVDDASSSAGPEVLRLIVPDAPVTGQPVSFTIAAQDDDQGVTGVSFDFGEGDARFGESSCRTRAPSRRATFSVPYRFSVPGPHVVRFELTSGSCGMASRITAGQVTVQVARGEAQVRAITGPDAGVLTKRCPNSDILPTRRSRTKVRRATLCLLNSVRRRARLRTLSSLRSLRRIAAQHSRDMVTRRYFDHTSPSGRSLVSRLKTIHWSGPAGENIGYGTAYYATARAMMWAWMHSSGHRANILERSYRWVGIAISLGAPTSNSRFGATYTTDFGGR